MTQQQLSKVWTLISIFLLGLQANEWMILGDYSGR
jgi:hypothetical protein